MRKIRLPRTEKDNITLVKENDKKIKSAKKKAQNGIAYFIEHLKKFGNTPKWIFSVKKHFVKYNQHEHMWVAVYSYSKGIFEGTLGNSPGVIKGMKYGDPIRVRKLEVDDWMFYDPRAKAYVGGYSIKAMK